MTTDFDNRGIKGSLNTLDIKSPDKLQLTQGELNYTEADLAARIRNYSGVIRQLETELGIEVGVKGADERFISSNIESSFLALVESSDAISITDLGASDRGPMLLARNAARLAEQGVKRLAIEAEQEDIDAYLNSGEGEELRASLSKNYNSENHWVLDELVEENQLTTQQQDAVRLALRQISSPAEGHIDAMLKMIKSAEENGIEVVSAGPEGLEVLANETSRISEGTIWYSNTFPRAGGETVVDGQETRLSFLRQADISSVVDNLLDGNSPVNIEIREPETVSIGASGKYFFTFGDTTF